MEANWDEIKRLVSKSLLRSRTSAQIAVDFLEKLRPDGPWVLTAIIPDGLTDTITARTAAGSKVRAQQ
jgi:hypothetical protein